MAFYVTDYPPVYVIGNIWEYIDGGDARAGEVEVVANRDGWTTYLTKKNQFLYDEQDINQTQVTEWAYKKDLKVVLKNENKLRPSDRHSFTSYLVNKAGMGSHEAKAGQNPVHMKPGDEVIFLEWNWIPILSWGDPDATTVWWHHIKNLRK